MACCVFAKTETEEERRGDMKAEKTIKYKYKRTITGFFMAFALLLSVGTVGFTFSLNYSSNEKYNTVTCSQAADAVDTTLRLSRLTINNIRYTTEAENWANAETTADERFYLLRLKEVADKQVTTTLETEFYLAMWKLDSELDSVMYKGYTYDKQKFFEEIISISEDKWEEVLAILERSGEYYLPVELAGTDDFIVQLYYQKYTGSAVVYAVLIPYSVIDSDSDDWMILNGENVLATGSGEIKEELLTYIVERLDKSESFLRGMLAVYVDSIGDGGLKYVMMKRVVSYQYAGGVIVAFFLLSFVMMFLMKKLADMIYQPIEKLILEIGVNPKDGEFVNEFDFFQNSVVELRLVNHKMEAALNQVSQVTQEHIYYEHLIGKNVEELPEQKGRFCLSVFAFSDETEEEILYIRKSDLKAYAGERDNLIFVNMKNNMVTLIEKTDSPEAAEETIAYILTEFFADMEVTVAVSGIKDSWKTISRIYQEALLALERKYQYPDKDILRVEEVCDIPAEGYIYPIATENELIFSVIRGDIHALEIFDMLTRENIRNVNVTSQMTQNYILAMINTVNRIFAEIKMTPEQLIGEDISFMEWAEQCNDPGIVFKIRNTLERIIRAIQSNQENSGNELIDRILDYIHKNYMYDIMLNDIARELGLSPQRCSFLFKQVTDGTFKDYLNRYRINKAKEIQKDSPDIKTLKVV